jgi:hypothetical protein
MWGFEVVEGTRRYTRHILFTGPKGEAIKARMTYDYQGQYLHLRVFILVCSFPSGV